MTDPTVPQQQPLDPVSAYIQGEAAKVGQVQALKTSMSYGLDQDPDQYAKLLQLSARTGVAPQLAKDFQPQLQKAATTQGFDFDKLVSTAPVLSTALSDPHFAAVAHDDVPTLASIEKTFGALPPGLTPAQRDAVQAERFRVAAQNMNTSEAGSALAATTKGAAGLPAFLFKPLGTALSVLEAAGASAAQLPTLLVNPEAAGENISSAWKNALSRDTLAGTVYHTGEDALAQISATQKAGPQQTLVDAQGHKFQNPDYAWWGRGLASMAESIPGALGGMSAFGALTAPLVSTEAMQNTYEQTKAEGGTAMDALARGSISAATNFALMGGGVPASPVAQSFWGKGLTWAARGTGLGLGLNATENLAARMTNDPNRPLFQGAAESVGQMLAWEGIPFLHAAMEGGQNRAFLDSVAQDATESKLRQRLPEAFRTYVKAAAEGTDVEEIGIPADKFQTFFQSQGVDPRAMAEHLQVPNFEEALASGTDLRVPVEQFAEKIAPEPQLFQGLVDDIRVRPGDFTQNELRAHAADIATASQQMQDQAEATRGELAEDPGKQKIFEDTRAQLVAAGYEPGTAEACALAHTQAMSTMAARAGEDPQALHEQYGLQVFRPRPGENVTDAILRNEGDRAAQGEPPDLFHQGVAPDFGPKFTEFQGNAQGAVKKLMETKDGEAIGALSHPDIKGPIDLVWGKEGTPEKDYQAGEVHSEDNRGFLQISNDRKMSIGLLQKADLSTFLHESHHMYLEVLGDLAAKPDAPEQIKQDYQTLREFSGAQGDEPLTREQHETLARAGEAYLMEGKAPSEKLQGVFSRFAGWMKLIYQKITSLGVKLTPAVRSVFDRMYASDQEIEAARARTGQERPLFTTAEGMGVSKGEFDLYEKTKGREIEAAKEDLNQQLQEELARQRDRVWKAEREDIKTEAAKTLDQEPIYRAHQALTRGEMEDGTPIKLDRQQLVDRLGEDNTKGLEREHGAGGRAVYAREGGMDLDTAAELLGFHSGDELAQGLRDMEPRADALDRIADEEMRARHGDMLTDGTVADKAVQALHNRFREDAMALELKALRQKQAEAAPFMEFQRRVGEAKSDAERKQAQDALEAYQADLAKKAKETQAAGRSALQVPPMDAFRTAARAFVNNTAVKDLSPQRFLDGQRIASRDAGQALVKGDFQAAGDAKQKEILNHFLYREALAAQKEVGKFEDFTKQLQSKAGQQRLGKAGGDYLDQVNNLLGRYEMAPKSNKALAARESLIEWANRLYADGKEPNIDPAILNEARQVNYRQAPMSEIRALRDALKNISHLAGQELGMLVNGKKIDFDVAVTEMVQSLRENFESNPLPIDPNLKKSRWEKVTDLAQRGDAMLMKMERLVDWADGGKLDGPWHRYIWDNIADAQGHEYDLASKVTAKLGEALENMPKEQRDQLLDAHDIEGLGRVTKKFILSAALNMGNEENQAKMLKGMGWSPDVLGRMMDHMDAKDWGFVQDTWNTLESLWPEIAALEQRMTGLEPVKVQPRAFEARDAQGNVIAQLEGGYYPVMYDPRRSVQGAKQEAGDVSKMFESGYARATTPKGHTIERTGFSAPMIMDFNQVLTQHTTKVIKDLTHREAVVAANKLITDRDIRSALQETLGPAYEQQMLPWLRGVVNDRNGSATQGLGDLSRWMMTLRSGTVVATMAYKATTMILQMTHIPRMMLYVKPGEFTSAMVDFLAHPKAMTDQVRGLSPNEMAFRGENLDRDIRENLLKETGENSLRHDATRMGMHGVAMIDHLVSVPLWLGVYRQSLKAGMEDSLAVNAADRAVRLGMGAGSPKDLPAIMRNNELSKVLTMFYGFHNGIYNQLRDAGHQVQGISDMGKFLGTGVLALLAPAILSQLVSGKGPADDENKALWAIKKSLLFGGDTIPILRDVSSALDRGSDYKFSPIAGAMEMGVKAWEAGASDKPNTDWGNVGIGAGQALGTMFGVPGTGQMAKTGNYLWHVHEGKIPTPTPIQAMHDSILGHQKDSK